MDLLLKDIENAARRVAGFESLSEWVGAKILLCAFFVFFQGTIENWLKVGRCGSYVSAGHKGETSSIVGVGERKATPQERVDHTVDRRARHVTTVPWMGDTKNMFYYCLL